MAEEDGSPIPPPPGAPPILTFDQARHLISQGWLPLELPDDLSADVRSALDEANTFFEWDQQDKNRLYPPSRGTESGFYHVPDEKEYLTFRHNVHPESSLEQCVQRVWRQAARLLHRVLCDLSRSGHFDVAAWDDMIRDALNLPSDDHGIEENISLMRLFRYYPQSGFAAEHVDVGLLTLCIGDGKGLQVLDRWQQPPQWIDVAGPVVLVGEVVRGLFNHRVRAGLHRVVGNPAGRGSSVFALRPCLTGNIDLSKFGGEGVVATREYFYKIKGSKHNINATKDIRDEQRRAQKGRRDSARNGVQASTIYGQR